MKGITIFLVVFGHCIQYGNGKSFDYFNDPLFKIIYSFHMPLFAVVSGYLFFWSVSSRKPREVITHQTNSLILPIFSRAVIVTAIRAALIVYTRNFAGASSLLSEFCRSFLGGLWFLWAMFFCSMIVLLAREKFNDSMKFYAAVLVMLLFVPDSITPATNIFMYPYFVAGYMWHREGMDEKFTLRKSLTLGVVLLWMVMLLFFDKASFIYTTGTAIVKYSQKVFVSSQLGIDVFRWAIGFAGSAAVLLLLRLVKPVEIFAALGAKSLGIYILHVNVVSIVLPAQGGYIINFFEAVLLSAICYLLGVVISRSRILNRFILGGR